MEKNRWKIPQTGNLLQRCPPVDCRGHHGPRLRIPDSDNGSTNERRFIFQDIFLAGNNENIKTKDMKQLKN